MTPKKDSPPVQRIRTGGESAGVLLWRHQLLEGYLLLERSAGRILPEPVSRAPSPGPGVRYLHREIQLPDLFGVVALSCLTPLATTRF